MTFRKYKSIERFPAMYKNWKYHYNNGNTIESKFVFNSKIKLHGTNACIVIHNNGNNNFTFEAQKRSQILSEGNDNFGFYQWVMNEFVPHFYSNSDHKITFTNQKESIYIYGEWAGPGIQKGVAVSNIPKRTFFAFEIVVVNNIGETKYPPCMISNLNNIDVGYQTIPNHKTYQIDFLDKNSIDSFVEEINNDVECVENCDPLIKVVYGVEGIGEGLVLTSRNKDISLSFKAKGDRHSTQKQRKPVEIDHVKSLAVDDYLNNTVTDVRLNQGVQELPFESSKDIGNLVKWVINDVKKECLDMLPDNLEFKDVQKGIGKRVVDYLKREGLH